jgi:hypothetical protein
MGAELNPLILFKSALVSYNLFYRANCCGFAAMTQPK